jgi:hypothetical protein
VPRDRIDSKYRECPTKIRRVGNYEFSQAFLSLGFSIITIGRVKEEDLETTIGSGGVNFSSKIFTFQCSMLRYCESGFCKNLCAWRNLP